MNDMKLGGETNAGIDGTASVIHKEEEMPYEGKAIGATRVTDAQGMKLEGSSDASDPETRDVSDDANKE